MTAEYRQTYKLVNRKTFSAAIVRAGNVSFMRMGERIESRMKKLGLTQAKLARLVGVTQPTINQLITGRSQKSSRLHRIAQVLDTNVDWLEGRTEDPSGTGISDNDHQKLADDLGLALVKELEIGYSMGGGAVMDAYPTIGLRAFEQNFLERVAKGPPSALFVATGDGDSMQPTLWHEDSVLIDTSQRVITQQDRIWALAYGDLGMIKRVRRLPSGSFLIISDNQTVKPFEAHEDEIHIIGRVVWIGRRI